MAATLRNNDSVDCGLEALDFDYEPYELVEPFQPENVQVTEPGVPFLHTLKQKLTPHSDFIIDGVIHDNGNKFTVDLCYHRICPRDNVYKKNIGFHFNPRLPMNCVVRNSFVDETWGGEEVHTFKRSPLKRGKHFIMEIFVAPTEYLVALNGSHFCSFGHRVPLTEISTIEVNGDIALNKVELTSSKYYPVVAYEAASKTDHLEVPYSRRLPHSIMIPSKIILEGTVFLLPFSFHVNLQLGSHVFPHPLVAFHMSVRWRPSQEDVIVFNSWTEKNWDSEVVLPMCNLFKPGASFTVEISIASGGFLVTVNDFTLPVFMHRMKPELIDTLYIQGDIKLTRAEIV